MLAVRWLLAKDLRILRRSPALSALLIIYPAVVAILIGLALSRGPGLPRVAFLNQIPSSETVITLGKTRIDTRRYERQLFQAIAPVPVSSRAQALADVRDGSTIAALIIPPDLPRRLASGDQSAYVQVIYNGDAVNQSLVETAIESELAQGQRGTGGAARARRRRGDRPAALRRPAQLPRPVVQRARPARLGADPAPGPGRAAAALAAASAAAAGRRVRQDRRREPGQLQVGDRRGRRADRGPAADHQRPSHAA